MGTSQLRETSMSALKTFLRCGRQYYYNYVQGLQPRTDRESASMGTLFHEALAHAYRNYSASSFVSKAKERIHEIRENGYFDRHRDRIVKPSFEPENWNLIEDMVQFYWQEHGQHDKFDTIVAVEEAVSYELRGFTIRNTFDLLVRENGRLVVYDHKTVSEVGGAVEFLPLDFQMLMYELSAFKHFGEPIEVVYNMVRRAVPPGFGHDSGLTATGKKSTRSKDPMDYVRRERISRSAEELQAFEDELIAVIGSIRHSEDTNTWLRSPIKTGGESCKGCSFYGICGAELAGKRIDPNVISLEFEIAA